MKKEPEHFHLRGDPRKPGEHDIRVSGSARFRESTAYEGDDALAVNKKKSHDASAGIRGYHADARRAERYAAIRARVTERKVKGPQTSSFLTRVISELGYRIDKSTLREDCKALYGMTLLQMRKAGMT